jgi:hypothetical protein
MLRISTEILFGRQRKRHKDTDLLRLDSEFAADSRPKTLKTALVVLEFGQFLQNTSVQLHPFVS